MLNKPAVKSAKKSESKDSVASNQVASVEANSIQESVKPLTEAEQQLLAECEAIIEKGFKTFIMVCDALVDVRDKKLYRASHKTFQDYCADRWKMTARHANRLMLSGPVVKNIESEQLVSSVPVAVPQNEAQTRPLQPLTKEKQVAAARIVAEKQGKHTAKDFKEAAKQVEGGSEAVEGGDDKPEVKSYDPRKENTEGNQGKSANSEKDKLENLLELVDQAETQARKIASCSDVVKVLSELSKTITRKLNGGAK